MGYTGQDGAYRFAAYTLAEVVQQSKALGLARANEWSVNSKGVAQCNDPITVEVNMATRAISSVTSYPWDHPLCPGQPPMAPASAPAPAPTARKLLRNSQPALAAKVVASPATAAPLAAAATPTRKLQQGLPRDLQAALDALVAAFW